MGLSGSELIEVRNSKILKPDHSNRTYGQFLLQIPKHLLKVSIVVIVGAFIGMFYLIANDQSLDEFIQLQEEELDLMDMSVHPLFKHLQLTVIKDNYIQHEIKSARQQRPAA